MSDKLSYDALEKRVLELESAQAESMKTIDALQKRETWHERLFDNMLTEVHVWKVVFDDVGNVRTWKLVDANATALRSWNSSLPEIIGKTTDEIFPNSNATQLFMPIVRKIFSEGKPHTWEMHFPVTNQFLHMVSIPIEDHFVSAGFDISDFEQAKENLIEANLKQDEAILAGKVGLWDWDLKTNKVGYSEAWKTQIGYEENEISDDLEEWRSRVHPDDLKHSMEMINRSIDEKIDDHQMEFRFRHKDGSYRWILAHASILRDENDCPVRMLGSHVDITDRKMQEIELAALKRRAQSLLDHSPVCQKIVDLDFNLQYMSANGFKMLKLEETDERYGQPYPFDFFPDSAREALRKGLEKAVVKKETISFDSKTCDFEGTGIWLHHTIIPILKDEGNIEFITVVSADITERKQREEALRRYEWLNEKEQLESVSTSDSRMPLYGDLTALNTCRVIANAVDKQSLSSMAQDLMDLLDTSMAVYEKNGDYAFGVLHSEWCRLLDKASYDRCGTIDTKKALHSGCWLCHENCWNDSAKAAIRSGAPTDIECIGGIHLYAAPIRAAEEIVGAVNIGYGSPPDDRESMSALAERFGLPFEDIQDAARQYKPRPRYIIDVAKRRCRAVARMIGDAVHKSRLEAQLAQADRLSSMGTLAAGVAHEINNPLAYTLYNLETVVEELPNVFSEYRSMMAEYGAGTERRDDISIRASCAGNLDELLCRAREALDGTLRIRSIARTLRTFSHVDDNEEGPIDIRHAVEHAENMVRNETKYRAQLLTDLAPTPPVLGSEGKLAQVFLSLLINAAHAIDEGDVDSNVIRIRTYGDGDVVVAEVSDTGRGIPTNNLNRLFEPFFTTKGLGGGSGLGLAVSKKIITDMGGTISCESRMGQGTIFRIHLPALQTGDIREKDAITRSVSALAPGGRILVVDDEPGVRSSICHMLGRDNHEVLTAASGAECKEMLSQDRLFDLIILDLMMPRVSGMDLHRWLSVEYPRLAERVIFVTGGVFTPTARTYLSDVDNVKLEKPLNSTTFRKLVSELIRTRWTTD